MVLDQHLVTLKQNSRTNFGILDGSVQKISSKAIDLKPIEMVKPATQSNYLAKRETGNKRLRWQSQYAKNVQ